MGLKVEINKNIEEVAEFVAMSINKKIETGQNVLWFVSGGSAIPLEVLIAKKVNDKFSSRLVITLTDERYGLVGHPNSNWAKLKESGFNIIEAKLIPFITGKDFETTTSYVNDILKSEIIKADYKIGVFGIGVDNHTAGMLPHSSAIHSNDFVCSYKTEEYDRITITGKTILTLDEAIIYAVGEKKWPAIRSLDLDIEISEAPSQILKSVPLLTIFTDYKK